MWLLFGTRDPVFVTVPFTHSCIDCSETMFFFFSEHSHSQHIVTLFGVRRISNHNNEEILQLNLFQTILTLCSIYILFHRLRALSSKTAKSQVCGPRSYKLEFPLSPLENSLCSYSLRPVNLLA